jgi:hypothetical protein
MTTVTTETTSIFYYLINTPMIVALLFALAGAFFIGIYFLRRTRAKRQV